MKKIVFIVLSIFCFNLYAQVTEGWNPIIVTGIPYVNLEPKQIATFANKDGIHVLTSLADGSQAVKYFRVKSDGTFPSGFPSEGIQLDTSGNLPTIVGDENFIFAVFHKVSNGVHTVEIRKSTDGINWDLIPSLDFQSDIGCNGVDATYNSANGLHVTWSEKVGANYESYYNIYLDNGWAFSTNQVVTNISPIDNGGMPTVTTSNNNATPRVHFSVNTGTGQNLTDNRGKNYSRDYRYSTWDNPIAILPSTNISAMDRLAVSDTDGKMHSFFYKQNGTTTGDLDMYYRSKQIAETSWGNETLLSSTQSTGSNSQVYKLQLSKTADGAVHVFWIDNSRITIGGQTYIGGYRHKKIFSDGTWSAIDDATFGGTKLVSPAVCSSSNDLFVVWGRYDSGWNTLRFHQYDAVPLAPQNLTVTKSANNHPLLSWTRNNEADLDHYNIYKKITEKTGFCSLQYFNN